MVVTVKLDDEVFAAYAAMDRQLPSRAIEKQLVRFKDVKPSDRALFLSTTERQELEKLLERTFENGAQLVARIKQAIAIEVGGSEVPLTETQRRRLTDQARFYAQDPKDLTRRTIQQILFERLGS